ncbi:hypothetical protein ACF06X_33825 [Streptomyces sp. NPDC015346]|uniref:hypothetical protein n=1 Tax=Streptomyces sp. NPDC015346 TaxID=3364954 RepID=UPI003700C984
MSEWGIALIAAGSAILGSITTGFFAWKAGHRQAEGAEAAGQAQANALIATVQATLDEQRRARLLDRRRQAYSQFLRVLDQARHRVAGGDRLTQATVNATLDGVVDSLGLIELEGPDPVHHAAAGYLQALVQLIQAAATNRSAPAEHEPRMAEARQSYLTAARAALSETEQA